MFPNDLLLQLRDRGVEVRDVSVERTEPPPGKTGPHSRVRVTLASALHFEFAMPTGTKAEEVADDVADIAKNLQEVADDNAAESK